MRSHPLNSKEFVELLQNMYNDMASLINRTVWIVSVSWFLTLGPTSDTTSGAGNHTPLQSLCVFGTLPHED